MRAVCMIIEPMRLRNPQPCSQPAEAPDQGLGFSSCNPTSFFFSVQSHHLALRAQDARDDQNPQTPGNGASTDVTSKGATKSIQKVLTSVLTHLLVFSSHISFKINDHMVKSSSQVKLAESGLYLPLGLTSC